jgi:ribosomal-protein-alanine N-acetyltransferase
MLMSFPVLNTSRLRLRQIVKADQQNIFKGLSHAAIVQFYGVRFSSFEEAQEQMDWYATLEKEQTGIWWAIYSSGNHFLGACGFNNWNHEHRRAEVGFWLFPDFQGKGIMTEALTCICEYAFDVMGLHRIEGLVESRNTASKRLLDKLAFVHEGTMRDCEWKDGRYISLDIYALIRP